MVGFVIGGAAHGHSYRATHHVQVSIPTSGADKYEVPAVCESRREVVAGLVSTARNLGYLSAAPPLPIFTFEKEGEAGATSSRGVPNFVFQFLFYFSLGFGLIRRGVEWYGTMRKSDHPRQP